MIESVEDLRSLVDGTMLADRDMGEVEVSASRSDVDAGHVVDGSRVLVVRIGSDEVLPAWQLARSLADRTGRWPVAACSFDFHFNASSDVSSITAELDRFEFELEFAGFNDPASIIERSRVVEVDAEFARLAAEADWLDIPDPAKVPGSVPQYNDWFEPTNQLVSLLLLPDPSPENALAYLHWFAASHSLPSHVLIAVLRRWHETFGAELVAHWGTMLQLVVSRRPASAGEALALARQQELVAPCTTTLPGASTEEHAATLLSSDRWFLHERP